MEEKCKTANTTYIIFPWCTFHKQFVMTDRSNLKSERRDIGTTENEFSTNQN